MGHPGVIDRPHEHPNVAMTLASVSMPQYLSDLDKVKPKPHFSLREKLSEGKVELPPEGYIKGDSRHRTNIPGIYCAGDAEGGYKQIVTAVDPGSQRSARVCFTVG